MRVGLFGGSFNPPHMGHAMVCFYLLETTPLDEIWLLPTFRHAFGKELAPFDTRLELCRELAQPFGSKVKILEVERDRGEVSYTIDTVRLLMARHPGVAFEWIVGSDILPETPRWKDFDTLKTLVDFRVLARKGFSETGGIVMPEVSSTEIRERLRQGEPVEGMLSRAVEARVRAHGLYGSRPTA